jgi:hypothetical protein
MTRAGDREGGTPPEKPIQASRGGKKGLGSGPWSKKRTPGARSVPTEQEGYTPSKRIFGLLARGVPFLHHLGLLAPWVPFLQNLGPLAPGVRFLLEGSASQTLLAPPREAYIGFSGGVPPSRSTALVLAASTPLLPSPGWVGKHRRGWRENNPTVDRCEMSMRPFVLFQHPDCDRTIFGASGRSPSPVANGNRGRRAHGQDPGPVRACNGGTRKSRP